MTGEPIGQLLDTLGVTADIDARDLVSGAVVLMKVTDAGGSTGLEIATSEGMDWITQLGIIEAARTIVTNDPEGEEL